MTWQRELIVETHGHRDLLDVTAEVGRLVASSGVTTGTVNVFVTGSTAAMVSIEFERGSPATFPRSSTA